jgi:hypothetical protein
MRIGVAHDTGPIVKMEYRGFFEVLVTRYGGRIAFQSGPWFMAVTAGCGHVAAG